MYFLARYGRMQALYFALGRGKLLNAQVIDVSIFPNPSLSLRALSLPPPVISAGLSSGRKTMRAGASGPWKRALAVSDNPFPEEGGPLSPRLKVCESGCGGPPPTPV